MRARPLLVPFVVALALLVPGRSAAHLGTEPSFIAAGSTERLVLTVHNDRDETMTGFRLTVPAGLRILRADGEEGWSREVEDTRATWTGGALAALQPVVFEVEVEAAGIEPGVAELRGDQLYPDGESLSWPVPLTVLPPGGSTDSALNGQAIATLAILGILVVATFGLVVWQRRRRGGRASA